MRRAAVVLLVTLAATAASAATLTERIDRTFDARAGALLQVDNTNGSITIGSWDQPKIRVRAEKVVDRADDDEARRILKELRVDISRRGDGGLSIATQTPRNNSLGIFDILFGHWVQAKVTYEITVPRSMSLDVTDVNGRVHVFGVNGDLKIETTNGRIEMERCGGSADVSSTNGRIVAELVTMNPQRQSRFETTNGRIVLTVPSNLAAEVDASTTNGGIDSELPVLTRGMNRHSLRGTNNGGGAKLKIRTTNGSIEIHSGNTVASASR
jgi:DUF4097 and DUF4098 domain-containing protein YvlB